MSDRICPLGEDCDLTVAWMAGREEARDQFRARIEQLETQLGLARIDADQQRARAEAAEAKLKEAETKLAAAWVRAESAEAELKVAKVRAALRNMEGGK